MHASLLHYAAPNPLTLTLLCCLLLRAHRFDDVIDSKDFTQASFDCLKRILTHMQVGACTDCVNLLGLSQQPERQSLLLLGSGL